VSSTAQWIVPAAGAQVAYALSIFGEKAVLRRGHVDAGALATGAALLNVVVAAALLAAFGFPDAPGADQLVLVGCGGLLYVYLVPYLRAIELDDVSSVVPLFQVVPVLTLALSLALGRVDVSTTELTGAAVVSLGTAMFVLGDPSRAGRPRAAAVRWMLLASTVLAVRFVILDGVVAGYAFTESAPLIAAGLAFAGLMACAAQPRRALALRRVGAGTWAGIAAAQSLNLAAEALVVLAVTAGPAAMVALTIGLQPAFVVAFGLALTRLWPRLVEERLDLATIALKAAAAVVVLDGLVITQR
jgi:drug/metabolite transporter (DMT)-like permease